jgi:predicted ATPase/DNA-binding CsgD family transcriptional regulator
VSLRRIHGPDHASATPRRGRSVGGNLPAELSSFVGRRRELAEIKRLIAEFRLVTLCGIGGVGKTRLAQRAAQAQRGFPDGVWFVDLAEVGRLDPPAVYDAPDVEVLAHVVATAVGLRELPSRPLARALCHQLAPRCLLLVLDNCEHLLPACATLVHTLLRACPQLRIVAGSREPLGLTGEATFPVPPLPTPGPDRLPPESHPAAGVTECDSVVLFTARAQAVAPGFRLTSDNLVEVVDICHRLDGLPLAIELAAARLRVLTPGQISARLTDRFALLSRGSRNAPGRQQTLRGCVDWSFDLCAKPEQRLWARMSVFSGSFELDAIEGICAGEDLAAADLLDLTASLLDKSIVNREDHGAVVRYRMLGAIRAYGHDRLREGGEHADLRRRHRDWYEELVERANTEWVRGRQTYWLNRLNQEQANLRAAVDFCLAEPGEAERALRISTFLPALACALQEHRDPAAPPDRDGPTPLTPREAEVAVLVARGLSNREIAGDLRVSQRTAETHVANILAKQGFTSRAQIAAWMAEQA